MGEDSEQVKSEKEMFEEFRKWQPGPRYDKSEHLVYRGVLDAIMGRSSFVAGGYFTGDDDDKFAYGVGYAEGLAYLEHCESEKESAPEEVS